jgi:hypothetical protein
MSTVAEEVPVINDAPPVTRPGYCPIHPEERLVRAYGGARGGEPSCPRCDQIKAWQRRKALHMKQQHFGPGVSCPICCQLLIEERQLAGLVPKDLTPMPVVHPYQLMKGSPHIMETANMPQPFHAPATKPDQPQPAEPAASPSHPTLTKAAPQQIIVKDISDIQHLAGSQPQPTEVQPPKTIDPRDAAKLGGKGGK